MQERIYTRNSMTTTLNTERVSFDDIIGQSTELRKQIELAKRAALSDVPVLIVGETGTGKELFARAIHFEGERKNGPFVAENCGAIPASLAEGLLFGNEKGAFTEAIRRKGRFEEAQGGTLFLDEINSMPVFLQSKLLRVLQERTVRRVGGNKEIPLNIRILTALNQSPEDLLEQGLLRMDLCYRLNVCRLNLPPLRERRDDIPLYVDSFIRIASEKYGKRVEGMDDAALHHLMNRNWPGNVRELRNVIEGAVAMSLNETILHLDSII